MKYTSLYVIVALSVVAVLILGIIFAHYSKRMSVKSPLNASEITPANVSLGYVSYLEAIVVVDNNPGNNSLRTAWGISMYIKADNLTILFDAGPDPTVLKENAKKLGLDLSKIDFIVISHEHGDHIGGLKYIAEIMGDKPIKVYVPKHMAGGAKKWIRELGFNVIEIDRTTVITKGVAVIGELYGPPYEQALAVNVKGRGLVIFVGCSHPGADNIVKKAVSDLNEKPYIIIGGFHLVGASEDRIASVANSLVKLGLKKIYPIHCSGDGIRRYISEKYPEIYGDGGVGLKIIIKEKG